MDLYSPRLSEGEPVELSGTLVRHWFRDSESGFGAASFQLADSGDRITIRGPIGDLRPGQMLELRGRVEVHPRFGKQVRVESVSIPRPEGRGAVLAYLASGLIHGVGPALAQRIVDHLGEATLDILEREPKRLREVPGIGAKKAAEIRRSLAEQRDLREVLLFLHGHGLPSGLAQRILEAWGQRAPALLQANPYRLAEDVIGVGFKRADEIAGRLGIAPESLERREAGLVHVLSQAVTREGSVCLPRGELLRRASELTSLPVETFDEALTSLASTRRVVVEKPEGLPVLVEELEERVYPLAMHMAELGLTRLVEALVRRPERSPCQDPTRMLESWTRRRGLRLAEGQRLALLLALRKPFAIVTGGPGVGKTTILAALCDLAAVDDQQVALAAPTGRAAKRMSEATGRAATTLHRLLEFQPGTGRFARNEQAPLEVDLVVVDECSMLDLPLAYQVLRAVGPATRLVFVGDVDQLPSVGPGRILADLVDSGLVPVARLDEVFRQGEGSRIVANAHRVRRGEMPLFPRDEGGEDPDRDCFFVETRDPGRALELATRIVCERIPRAYGLDPIEDVQVLAPMYRGPLGVDALNRALGDRLVPGGRELERGGHRYRVGDKVLAVQNDYELELFNGDPGRLLALDDEAGRARFRFGGRELELPYDELGRVVPAYAITVHRAQGSEYPAVVLALDRGHYMLLYRRLLYTAMTRASRLLVLVGSRWALERAVGNDREGDRCTGLGLRLRHRAVGDGVHPEASYPPRDPQA